MDNQILGSCTIAKSQISSAMNNKVTKALIYDSWSKMLRETDYASDAINLIEEREIYRKDQLLVDANDSVIKPDHTAARGFVDGNQPSLGHIDPNQLSYQDLQEIFHPLTGTSLSVLLLQILGATLATQICNFKIYHAKGTNLFFHSDNDIIVSKTKHFVSNQDINQLPEEVKAALDEDLQDWQLPISASDWESFKKIYNGENLSENELADLLNNLPDKIYARSWNITSRTAKLLKQLAGEGNKAIEYSYSTYLRGSGLNHGTWRVSDIFRGYGILTHLGKTPVPVRGPFTILEQTAGIATTVKYATKDADIVEAPGAFLEIASRPYMLLNSNNNPIDLNGNEVDLDDNGQPALLKEIQIELDSTKWTNDKIFKCPNGRILSLEDINNGAILPGSKLTSNGIAICYEGFKESNAAGIFQAAGASAENIK